MDREKIKVIYLTQVDLTKHYSGSVHIKEVVSSLLKKNFEVTLLARKIGTFQKENSLFKGIEVDRDNTDKKRYFIYQLKLLLNALKISFQNKKNNTIFYVRSESAMFAHIIASILTRIPYILEFNSWPFRDVEKVHEISPIMKILLKILFTLSIKQSKGIVCVTPRLAELIRENFHLDNKYLKVVPNGVNTSIFSPQDKILTRDKFRIPPYAFVLCYVAYFQYYNDVEILIENFETLKKKIPTLTILLVGGWAKEERKKSIKEKIEKYRNYIILTDEVPYSMIPEYINASDICLSLFNTDVGDGSVMKVYEYLSCGKPVIGSDIVSQRFLHDMECGITVPIGDKSALIKAIESCYSNPQNIERMGMKGREYILKNCSWDSRVNLLRDIILKVANY